MAGKKPKREGAPAGEGAPKPKPKKPAGEPKVPHAPMSVNARARRGRTGRSR